MTEKVLCPVCETPCGDPSLGSICPVCEWERDSDEESNDPLAYGPNGSTLAHYRVLWRLTAGDATLVRKLVRQKNEILR